MYSSNSSTQPDFFIIKKYKLNFYSFSKKLPLKIHSNYKKNSICNQNLKGNGDNYNKNHDAICMLISLIQKEI